MDRVLLFRAVMVCLLIDGRTSRPRVVFVAGNVTLVVIALARTSTQVARCGALRQMLVLLLVVLAQVQMRRVDLAVLLQRQIPYVRLKRVTNVSLGRAKGTF